MRAVVQRVTRAAVSVEGEVVGQIEHGFLVLLGVAADDQREDAVATAAKIVGLRVFEDDVGKMNRSLSEVGGAVLAVSQFTLLGDCRTGRRPSFVAAAPPELANRLYQEFIAEVRGQGIPVATGRFQAAMQVSLVNDGPVTLLIDSRKLF
jgi:D-aminoacyl-tRNA deacylase